MAIAHERRGSGEPLLLIHGIGSQWQVWTPVLDRLAGERDVISIDLPGFGASPPLPSPEVPSPGALAGAVGAFLDELGLERAHVGGNSLGGWVALELAKAGRARSVTALSPAGFWNARELAYARRSLQVTRRLAVALAPLAPRLASTAAGRAAALGQVVAHPARVPAAAAADMIENLARSPGFGATLAASIAGGFEGGDQVAVPVTIAWAQRDRLLLPRQARRAAHALPHCRSVTLVDCGHVPTYDDPELVASVLLAGSAAG